MFQICIFSWNSSRDKSWKCLPFPDRLSTVMLETVTICQMDFHSPSWSIILQRYRLALLTVAKCNICVKNLLSQRWRGWWLFWMHSGSFVVCTSSAASINKHHCPVPSGRWHFCRRQKYSSQHIGARCPVTLWLWTRQLPKNSKGEGSWWAPGHCLWWPEPGTPMWHMPGPRSCRNAPGSCCAELVLIWNADFQLCCVSQGVRVLLRPALHSPRGTSASWELCNQVSVAPSPK